MTPSNQPAAGNEPHAGGYCSECGAPLLAAARFCHRCGTIRAQQVLVDRPSHARLAVGMPWAVAAMALVVVVVLVSRGEGTSPPARTPLAPAPGAVESERGGQLPDIGAMTPSERANRLYVRVMQYAEAGEGDSVARFAPMVVAAHQMLSAPTDDERYHFGRIGEVVGNLNIAGAQAETVLVHNPSSLLGLLLAARIARIESGPVAAEAFDRRLLAALDRELATRNADYDNHRAEIDLAVAEARRRP